MRINVAVPEKFVSAPVLNGALETVTRLNEALIRAGQSPTSDSLIEQGARWQPEPPGAEHFDHGGLIAGRGHGDCDDWAPLHAATLRVTGEDPGAKAIVRRSGPQRWHALVRRSDGSFDDPSIEAGMPGPGRSAGVHGAWLPIMAEGRRVHGVGGHVGSYLAQPQLALRPLLDRMGQVEAWQARADLPWHWKPGKSPTDVAMVSLHQSPVSDQAVVGAVLGAYDLGATSGNADPEHLKRLLAIADACDGCPWEELAQRYGDQHATAAGAVVGSLFGKIFKGIKSVAKHAISPALSLIPGGGLAKAAFSMASPALRKALSRGHHKKPSARRIAPHIVRPSSAHAFHPSSPRPPAPPAFMPYPYPLPYPIPMGQGWGGGFPGAAWPPRGR